MHLEKPYLTTNRYTKQAHKKWSSSAAKQRAAEEQEHWQQLQQQWQAQAPQFSSKPVAKSKPQAAKLVPTYPPGREPQQRIPSRDTGVTGAVTCNRPPQYTGDKIIGIGTMHKSNAVPIFNDAEAKDISSMRR